LPCLGLALTIDDFSVGPVVVSRVGPAAAIALQTGLDPAHVLGGGRDIVVGDSGSGNQSLAIDTAARELRFNIASGLGYFHITYGSAAQPLNVDLRAGGANSFQIEFGAGSIADLNFISVLSSSGESFTGAGRSGTTSTPLPDGRVLANVPFSTLDPQMDLSSIQRMELEFFRLPTNVGPIVKSFTTVPEPSVAGLVVAGVLMLAGCSRRR
jgi:hypothetical protein